MNLKLIKTDYESNKAFVRSQNELQNMLGGNQMLKTVFGGGDGVYYDPVGNEIFVAKKIGTGKFQGVDCFVYQFDFGDEKIAGIFFEHGFNEYLGAK